VSACLSSLRERKRANKILALRNKASRGNDRFPSLFCSQMPVFAVFLVALQSRRQTRLARGSVAVSFNYVVRQFAAKSKQEGVYTRTGGPRLGQRVSRRERFTTETRRHGEGGGENTEKIQEGADREEGLTTKSAEQGREENQRIEKSAETGDRNPGREGEFTLERRGRGKGEGINHKGHEGHKGRKKREN
jgi:hypothetical protein